MNTSRHCGTDVTESVRAVRRPSPSDRITPSGSRPGRIPAGAGGTGGRTTGPAGQGGVAEHAGVVLRGVDGDPEQHPRSRAIVLSMIPAAAAVSAYWSTSSCSKSCSSSTVRSRLGLPSERTSASNRHSLVHGNQQNAENIPATICNIAPPGPLASERTRSNRGTSFRGWGDRR